ncbi:MAG: tripartite tricarboxylate transporter permease [Deltaproteobacteria bacterium]
METLQQLIMGFHIAVTPINLLLCFLGAVAGTIIGALPGIGPSAGLAILLPLTFGMNPTSAMIMMAGLYCGAMYGGTITSVLINVPGESSSVMTCLDGYQMALQGRAGKALGIAAIGSFIAGTASVVFLMLLSIPLVKFALSFGPPEYFALMLMGLCTIAGLTGGSVLKALVGTFLGLLISTPGMDAFSGLPRLTFGLTGLLGGVNFLVVAVGLFGIGEVLYNAEQIMKMEFVTEKIRIREVWPNREEWRASAMPIIRGTFIGFIVGVLPGAGSTIASFMSYATEKRFSKHPELFGKGAIEGVAGPESANNSATGGAMVPLLTLGIPGSGTTAIMLGALMMFGLQPGPLLFQKNPDFVWGVIASMYIGNIMLLIMNIACIPLFVKILKIPNSLLFPLIIVFATVGVYSVDGNIFDVWMLYVFGVMGYFMKKFDMPPAPVVLSVVLGPMIERALRQSLAMSLGSYDIFFTRPISAVLLLMGLAAVVWPVIDMARQRYRARTGNA